MRPCQGCDTGSIPVIGLSSTKGIKEMDKHFKISFKYADSYSNWEWRNQSCEVYARNKSEAKRECIKIYGLGTDCMFEFLSIEEI